MRSLFDRLKPDYLEVLWKEGERFPFAVKDIVDEMQREQHWTDLKFSTVVNLSLYLRLDNYRPSTINELFDYEND